MFNSGISSENDKIRFWSKVIKTETCWIWNSNSRGGYGLFKFQGKNWQAHRISFEITKGSLPMFMDLHHKCNNKRCVNPDHLELVTELNHPGCGGDLNRNKTHCPQGHEYTIENTFKRFTKSGKLIGRWCRECARLNATNVNEQRRIKAKSLGISVREMLGQ